MKKLDCLLVKEQSVQYQISPHLLRNLNGKDKKCSTQLRWRHAICDWYYDFVDYFKFDREVVEVAVNYFDRYTSISADSLDAHEPTSSIYHTVAITSLFLAIKLHATSCVVDDPQELRNRALRKILYDSPQPKIILDMEMNILKALEWYMNPPTLHQFAFMFHEIHPARGIYTDLESYIHETTSYQVELAIFVPKLLAKFKPSIIAYAALKNVEEKIAADKPHIVPTDMKQSYEALTSHTGVTMDPIAVARCKALLKSVCPELPDLDFFHNTVTHSNGIDMQMDKNILDSPTIVVDFDAV